MSEVVIPRVKKPNAKRSWVTKELSSHIENVDDWVPVPKFLVFENEVIKPSSSMRFGNSPEQEKIGTDTEVITFCVTYSESRKCFLYGVSVKAPGDQTWVAYGKAIAKSRLRNLLTSTGDGLTLRTCEFVPVSKFSRGFPPARQEENTEEANEAVKEMAKEVYQHFIPRIVHGDMIDKFPSRMRNNLISGCFRLVSPSIV